MFFFRFVNVKSERKIGHKTRKIDDLVPFFRIFAVDLIFCRLEEKREGI